MSRQAWFKAERFLIVAVGLMMVVLLPVAAVGAAEDGFEQLRRMDTFSELVRHLYRWNLDEEDFDKIVSQEALEFEVIPLKPMLDEGDRSLYAEVLIPALSTAVLMKKTDYAVEELGVTIRSDRFKIVNVEKREMGEGREVQGETFRYPVREMMEYLFKTRSQPDFPSSALSSRLGEAMQAEIRAIREQSEGIQTVFVAPLSPVANEVWAFWEDEKVLVRWASDIELSNPAVWEHESLAVKVFDIEAQVVITLSEAPGSNAYLTRDQVGRVLFNCVILGEKRLVTPKPR